MFRNISEVQIPDSRRRIPLPLHLQLQLVQQQDEFRLLFEGVEKRKRMRLQIISAFFFAQKQFW